MSTDIKHKAISDLHHADHITGRQFELYMTNILNGAGYHNVITTPASNDGGLDAIGYDQHNVKIGWQFKKFGEGKTVPFHAVEEAMFGELLYQTVINIVLTNRRYSDQTWRRCKQARKNQPDRPIYLVDRKRLLHIFDRYERDRALEVPPSNGSSSSVSVQLSSSASQQRKRLNDKSTNSSFVSQTYDQFSSMSGQFVDSLSEVAALLHGGKHSSLSHSSSTDSSIAQASDSSASVNSSESAQVLTSASMSQIASYLNQYQSASNASLVSSSVALAASMSSISSVSASLSQSVMLSKSTSLSASMSASQSISLSQSVSFSKRASLLASASVSQSIVSLSQSVSLSKSASLLASISASQLITSLSQSVSFSKSISLSASLSASRSMASLSQSISFSESASLSASISSSQSMVSLSQSASLSEHASLLASASASQSIASSERSVSASESREASLMSKSLFDNLDTGSSDNNSDKMDTMDDSSVRSFEQSMLDAYSDDESMNDSDDPESIDQEWDDSDDEEQISDSGLFSDSDSSEDSELDYKICPRCHTSCGLHDPFCFHCGYRFNSNDIICPYCHNICKTTDKFCTHCGRVLKNY